MVSIANLDSNHHSTITEHRPSIPVHCSHSFGMPTASSIAASSSRSSQPSSFRSVSLGVDTAGARFWARAELPHDTQGWGKKVMWQG